MARPFTSFSWWMWRKHKEPKICKGSIATLPEKAEMELEFDSMKFQLDCRRNVASTTRRVRRKWQSREARKVDKERDIVIVPSDSGCVSCSDSDDSDWSIGWMEPLGSSSDDSFAVLVPCYGYRRMNFANDSKAKVSSSIANIPDIYGAGSKKYMEQWLSSLQNI